MTHTITIDQWAWLYISMQTIMEVDSAYLRTDEWAWHHISTDSNLHKWAWFVHTYRLMNGRGYHMSTDSNLHKWAWLMKEAGLRYDV